MREDVLNLEEAMQLCEQYKDLVGEPFCGEYRNLGNIITVAVCPYHKLDKHYFLQQYKLHKDANAALVSYAGDEYDAVIIGHDALGQPTCRELRAHLAYISTHPVDIITQLD